MFYINKFILKKKFIFIFKNISYVLAKNKINQNPMRV